MGRNEVFSETNASPNSVYIYYVAIAMYRELLYK